MATKDTIKALQLALLNDNSSQDISPEDTRDSFNLILDNFLALIQDELLIEKLTNLYITDNAITTSKIADTAVSNNKLATSSVSTAKIQAAAVQTASVKDLNITLPKLSQAVQDLLLAVGGGTITNNPDDEDLESVASVLKFKDRTASGNQKGYKIIRQDFDFVNIPAGYENSIWEIRYEHNIGGLAWTIPSGVTLKFVGGTITNSGNITLDNTTINADRVRCFDNTITFTGRFENKEYYPEWFNVDGADDTLAINIAIKLAFIGNIRNDLFGSLNQIWDGKKVSLKSGYEYQCATTVKHRQGVILEGNNAIFKASANLTILEHVFTSGIFDKSNYVITDLLLDANNISNLCWDCSIVVNSYFRNVHAINSLNNGIEIRTCQFNTFESIRASHNDNDGIVISTVIDAGAPQGLPSLENIFSDIISLDNGRDNLRVANCGANNFSRVSCGNAGRHEILLKKDDDPIITGSNGMVGNSFYQLVIERNNGVTDDGIQNDGQRYTSIYGLRVGGASPVTHYYIFNNISGALTCHDFYIDIDLMTNNPNTGGRHMFKAQTFEGLNIITKLVDPRLYDPSALVVDGTDNPLTVIDQRFTIQYRGRNGNSFNSIWFEGQAGNEVFGVRLNGDSFNRIAIRPDGTIRGGNGTTSTQRMLWHTGATSYLDKPEFKGAYDEPLRIGSIRLWNDGSGNLRIKNGSDPSNATDGTIIS